VKFFVFGNRGHYFYVGCQPGQFFCSHSLITLLLMLFLWIPSRNSGWSLSQVLFLIVQRGFIVIFPPIYLNQIYPFYTSPSYHLSHS
jgi:hypothetical protein